MDSPVLAMNVTTLPLPPLPAYTLTPQPSLFSFASDPYVALALPIIAYWVVSFFFHLIDQFNLFPQYRLHTPAELLKRNHASRWDVLRDVILQHVIQTIFGLVANHFEPAPLHGKEDYDVAVWAQRLRIAQRGIPWLLAGFGVDSAKLGLRWGGAGSTLSSILSGGQYPALNTILDLSDGHQLVSPSFASWELSAAKLIYWALIPSIQFVAACAILDSWQYWLHRTMHLNHYLYTKFHSRHHRLYVPYAYGALYNHPVEGFMLDTLGSGVAYFLTGMTARQAICFFTFSTIKTVDDHCGYAFPWDPLQHITRNNAAYHDIHHQSWGIKTNFSQPFFTVWDGWMGTMWRNGDVKLRYDNAKRAADQWWEDQKKFADEQKQQSKAAPSNGSVLSEKPSLAKSEDGTTPNVRRSPRKVANGSTASSAQQLKGLKERVSGSLPGGVPRVDSRR
jgi:sphinganine C4-monooxygenase